MADTNGGEVAVAGTEGASGGPPVLKEGERYDTKLTPGKIFVGGLASDVSEADLKEYFGAYGTIADAVVMRDKLTGNGRGFGFVTFADGAVAERVIAQRHEIKGRSVEAKSAVPRNEGDVQTRAPMGGGGQGGGRYGNDNSQLVTKIFVGGISPSVDEAEFKEYFGAYGRISDIQLMTDRDSGRSRGFGFVTYEETACVETVMMKKDHNIKGKVVEVKKAFPRNREGGGPQQGGMGGQQGGRGQMPMQGMMGMGGYGGQGGYGQSVDPRMMQMYSMMMGGGGGDPYGMMGGMGQMGGMGGYPQQAAAPAASAYADPYAQQGYAAAPAAGGYGGAPQDPYAGYAQQGQQPQLNWAQPAAAPAQYAQQGYAQQPAQGGYDNVYPGGAGGGATRGGGGGQDTRYHPYGR